MNILGIETSCDETASAVVTNGTYVRSNVVYTQIPLHQPYGGVVPEIASRSHIEKIYEVINAAFSDFTSRFPDEKIDAIAVTYGPGLSPALLVGLNAAKGLAFSLKVPLVCINHIEAHLHTPFLTLCDEVTRVEDSFPALGLAISGGHTNWFHMSELCSYKTIGQTLDDAAGEAFDKAAKLLNLGYPGGPIIDKIARAYLSKFSEALIPFPKGHPREGVSALAGLSADLCVSFSGLKTALLRYTQQHPELFEKSEKVLEYDKGKFVSLEIARVVASYQEAIVQAVADRTRRALKKSVYRSLIIGGGVSLNSRLREVLKNIAEEANVAFLTAAPKFCGDNAAMIAALAYFRQNIKGEEAFKQDVAPSLEID